MGQMLVVFLSPTFALGSMNSTPEEKMWQVGMSC